MDPAFLLLFSLMLFSLAINSRRLANRRRVELDTLDTIFTKPLMIEVTTPLHLKPKEGHRIFFLSDGTVRVTYEFWREDNNRKSMELVIVDVTDALGVTIGFCNEGIETLEWHQSVVIRKPALPICQYNEAVGFLRRVRNRVIEVLNAKKTHAT